MLSRAEKKTLKILLGVGAIAAIIWAVRNWQQRDALNSDPFAAEESAKLYAETQKIPEVMLYER